MTRYKNFLGACICIHKDKEDRNKIGCVSTSHQAQENIEMKNNLVYGMIAKSSDQEYENLLNCVF